MRRNFFSAVCCAVGVLLAACGGSHPSPTQATSSTQLTPAPVTVSSSIGASVTFPNGASCSGVPCTLSVEASARSISFPGDVLTYHWSGCATGNSPQALCVMNPDGIAVAAVTVTDAHGNTVTASATAQGAKRAPYVALGSFMRYTPAYGGVWFGAMGAIIDPDEGRLEGGSSYGGACPYISSLTMTGDCRPAVVIPGCSVELGLEIDVGPTASSGTCAITIQTKNKAGAIGTSIFTLAY